MKILWVATKAPWPPIDGGRLLLWNTLGALRDAGHRITLVAPVDPREFDLDAVRSALEPRCAAVLVALSPRPMWRDVARSFLRGMPLTVARHARPEVARRVAEVLREGAYDFMQVEQLQALAQVPPDSGVPFFLRAQNVESDLWRATAGSPSLRLRWLRGPILRLDAGRLARWEAKALADVAGTIALTQPDAERLAEFCPAAPIRVAPAPVDGELPLATRDLEGAPSVILMGSAGWLPNRDGAMWFLDRVWPRLHGSEPTARLHVFGLEAKPPHNKDTSVVFHGTLAESREAFARGAILVVPLSVASGVRMKIIEAWARGIPVVATPAAAGGLEAEWGRELVVAATPEEMAESVIALARDPHRAASMVASGRERLARSYSPSAAVAALEAAWSSFGLGGTSPNADEVMKSA